MGRKVKIELKLDEELIKELNILKQVYKAKDYSSLLKRLIEDFKPVYIKKLNRKIEKFLDKNKL